MSQMAARTKGCLLAKRWPNFISIPTRVDERFIRNTKSITTVVGQNSTILSNDIANVAASKEEVEKAKEKIEEYKGKLGLAKAISLVTSRPILYITIYRINLEEIREDQSFYDQYKEFKDFSKNLEVYASLSYRLPETELKEEPKEVWRNADILILLMKIMMMVMINDK